MADISIKLKQDTEKCNYLPNIDMIESVAAVTMVQAVADNYKGFTKKCIKKAILHCKVQAMNDYFTKREYKQAVGKNLLLNIPIILVESPWHLRSPLSKLFV